MATTEQTSSTSTNMIAFQGEPGAYSHLACRTVFPDREALPCATFEAAFAAVEEKRAEYAMIPIENSVAGRVADIHQLMPHKNLHIVGEHFQRVNHHLLVLPGTKMEDLDLVRSHEQALGQCREHISKWGLKAETYTDTAGAAKLLAQIKDPGMAAIASSLAGEIYGLESLKQGIEDADHNTTRFLILSRENKVAPLDLPCVTTFIFQTRNVPASLYKALGGFATNGINITKLESYQLEGTFNATQFYADIEGHPEDPSVKLAMEELDFFTNEVRILGTYPQADYRIEQQKKYS
ncbi:prephenate dehydratase [Emcibacter sp.]|uniref:prephenate dehydratase n=1 Tax=Emcibacter sp. TaxID=1979954 RepID=UPI003A92F5A8